MTRAAHPWPWRRRESIRRWPASCASTVRGSKESAMSATALLADILEHHDDDTPRLVYADWLDEHGEADRAEFIRVQCELARGGIDQARREHLEEREQALLH